MEHFERFYTAFIEMNRAMLRVRELELRRLDLHPTHAVCLYYLLSHPEGVYASEMSALTKEDKAAISRALADLAARGMVVSEKAEGRRAYRNRWYLTEEGRRTAERLGRRIRHAYRIGGKDFTAEEERSLLAAMEIILRNLSEYTLRAERFFSAEEERSLLNRVTDEELRGGTVETEEQSGGKTTATQEKKEQR